MKIPEIRDLPTEEIRKQLADVERALFNLRFQRESEQLEKPDQIRKAKKDVARFLTVLRERETSEQVKEVATEEATT